MLSFQPTLEGQLAASAPKNDSSASSSSSSLSSSPVHLLLPRVVHDEAEPTDILLEVSGAVLDAFWELLGPS